MVSDEPFDVPKQPRTAFAFNPDETLAREIMRAFTWEYTHAGYENFPVKSSATGLISRMEAPMENTAGDAGFGKVENHEGTLFDLETEYAEKGATGKAAGIAYHAFLEKFDFALLYDENGDIVENERLKELVLRSYERLNAAGELENAQLLSVDKLTEILSNPVFSELRDTRLFKEQQFLVSLPIKDTFGMVDEGYIRNDGEEMLFQGAIDLLAVGEDGVHIVDYKYSVKNAETLRKTYAPQLALYRLATAKIMGISPEKIRCSIVNIYHGFQVDMS